MVQGSQGALNTMFSNHVEHCHQTGCYDLPPQYGSVCPGADQKNFGRLISVYIHKSLGFTDAECGARWTQAGLKDALEELKTALNSVGPKTRKKFKPALEKLNKSLKFSELASSQLKKTIEAVRSFLRQLFLHSATRVIDQETS